MIEITMSKVKSPNPDDLKSLVLMQGIPKDVLLELCNQAPSRVDTYTSGNIIAMQGFPIRSLLILLRGRVRAQMTNPEGKRLTIDEIVAPELLASAFVYSSENSYPVTIEAIETSIVWSIDREYWLDYMSKHRDVMRNFLQIISDRGAFLSKKVHALSLQSLRERLINYLRTHGATGKLEDLSLMLGVARPSLSRLLAELTDEGVLCKANGGYILVTTQ